MGKSSFIAVNSRYDPTIDVPSTSEVQDLNSDNLQYDDDDSFEVSNPSGYYWQFSGHRFIGERVSVIYPNGLTAIGTVQKYLPPF